MRYLIVSLVSLSLLFGIFSSPILARGGLTPAQINKIEQRVRKLNVAERKAAIKALNAKHQRMKKMIKAGKIQARRRQILLLEIERVEKELELLNVLVIAPPPSPPPPGPPIQAPLVKPLPKPLPLKPPVLKPRSPQVGLSAGYIGGIPAVLAEIRFHEPFDLISTSCRIGAAYAQGEDTDKVMRKHALIVLEGIYRLNPPYTKGIRSYFGLGVNYDAYTTGQVSGDLGGGAFYGIEGGPPDGGQMFFEIGYGTIRTGFSPNYTGITALLGYKF